MTNVFIYKNYNENIRKVAITHLSYECRSASKKRSSDTVSYVTCVAGVTDIVFDDSSGLQNIYSVFA